MRDYSLKEVMTVDPVSVEFDTPVWVAWRKMRRNNCHNLPVIRNSKVVGVTSERDLFLISGIGNEQAEVREAMDREPLKAKKDMTLSYLIQEMVRLRKDVVVVVNGKDGLEGIFTIHDVLNLIQQEMFTYPLMKHGGEK